jgi:hypothetical protein
VLARARADKVRELLVAKGIAASRLGAVGQWPGPVSARRVDLVVVGR